MSNAHSGMEPAAPARVLLCTNGGLHGALVMRRLAADPRIQLVGIIISSRVFGRSDSWLQGVWRLYRTSGLRYLLYLWATTGLAETVGAIGALPPVKKQAAALGCPVLITADVNALDGIQFVDDHPADLLVSAFFNQRIGARIFQQPRLGAVNIHPSLLPALKGVDPVFYARLRDVQPIGVTVHHLAAELDTGSVIAQQSMLFGRDVSVLGATSQLFQSGAALLLGNLDRILAGDLGESQQDAGNYDSWPSPAQVSALVAGGTRLVDRSDLCAMYAGQVGQ